MTDSMSMNPLKAYVPALWRPELGNVLAQAERRKYISAAQIAAHLGRLGRLPIVTDTEEERADVRGCIHRRQSPRELPPMLGYTPQYGSSRLSARPS